jgi:AraC family transcriptional regulator, exoenzyme S synthesis regulatory protein ExsA
VKVGNNFEEKDCKKIGYKEFKQILQQCVSPSTSLTQTPGSVLLDIFRYFKDDPKINKLVGSDYLFAEYKCPLQEDKYQFIAEFDFITFIVTGKKDWYASGKMYHVQEGSALYIRKGVYTTRQYLDEDHCVLTCFMTDDFIRNFMRENTLLGAPGQENTTTHDQIFEIDIDDMLRALFSSMFNYLNMGSDIPRKLVELKFNELLFNIVLNEKNKKIAKFFTSLNRTNKWNFEEVMMKNFHFDLELEEFARLCGRSLSTFKRDFKNFFQQTPGKWLIDRRLEYASSLLMSSDLNVNEICHESGFRNSSHFNKVFKDRYRLPPKQFREIRKGAVVTD